MNTANISNLSCKSSSKNVKLSSRCVKRLLYYMKNKSLGTIIFKSRSVKAALPESKVYSSYIDPDPIGIARVSRLVIEHTTEQAHFDINSIEDEDLRFSAECANLKFEKGLVPRVQKSSGAVVYLTSLRELVQLWLVENRPYPMRYILGWATKSESAGLVGGVRPTKQGRRRRPRRQGRRQPTTNKEVVSSNLSIPRSLPPQYSRNSWSYISSVSSDASGKFNFYCNIRNPAKAINGSGQYVRAVEDAKIWDGYYVKSFILQMVPIIPTTVTAGMVVGAVDQEGISPVTTPTYDTLIDRRYRFMFMGRQAKTTTIRPKPLTSGTFEGRVCPIIESGKKIFYDYEFPPDQGIIEVAGEGFPATSALFQIFLWMEVINFSPRTLPGIAPPRFSAQTIDGRYVPNPQPVIPLRRRMSL